MTYQSTPLGEKLTELREDNGLTKASLSRKAGINQHTIIRIERGEVTNPSMLVMIRLSEVLHVPIESWVMFIEALNPKE